MRNIIAGLVIGMLSLDGADNQVSITEHEGLRIIVSNGIPDHATGDFPNHGNPNRIAAQRHRFQMPLQPQILEQAIPYTLGTFGVAINGVPFDPGAAEWWRRNPRSGWRYEALVGHERKLGLDEHNAHVQPTGTYHYHAIPEGLVQRLGAEGKRMQLIGWAADGFPIYARYGHRDADDGDSPLVLLRSSYQLREGSRPAGNLGPGGRFDGTFTADWTYVAGSGDLDDCNGRVGVTPDFPDGTYHYILTDEFPYIPRAWRGQPDASFLRRGGRQAPGRGPHHRQR